MTVGSNLIVYPNDYGAPTVNLLTVKLLLISVLLNPGAKFMTSDIKDFYLDTPMDHVEYTKLKLSDLPGDCVARYNLEPKADKKRAGLRCEQTR